MYNLTCFGEAFSHEILVAIHVLEVEQLLEQLDELLLVLVVYEEAYMMYIRLVLFRNAFEELIVALVAKLPISQTSDLPHVQVVQDYHVIVHPI